MNLGSLGCGQEAVVAGVNGSGAVMMRLMEIGLIPGRVVSVLRRAPFGGPIELLVDKTRLAVRTAEADCVEVTSEPLVQAEVAQSTVTKSKSAAVA